LKQCVPPVTDRELQQEPIRRRGGTSRRQDAPAADRRLIVALREAATANRHESETIRQALLDVATRQHEALLHLVELRSAHAGLLASGSAASDALREARDQHRALVQDREDTAERIEAVLRRLTEDRPAD
jgi:hypothetical protein